MSRVGLPHTPGSPTSKAAAQSMVKHAPNQRQKVWRYIDAQEGGATCDEIEVALGMHHASAATRVMELRDMGRLKKTLDTRPTRKGRPAAVHVSVDPAWWPTTGWGKVPRKKSELVLLKEEHARLQWRFKKCREAYMKLKAQVK